MKKIRKGDEVIVIAGRDKGKRGKVLSRVSEEYCEKARQTQSHDGCAWRHH